MSLSSPLNTALKSTEIFETYYRQEWPLPDSIIYYITMTPSSSRAYQKMIKTCKYFFAKNPIIVTTLAHNMYYRDSAAMFEDENNLSYEGQPRLWATEYLVIAPQTSILEPYLAFCLIPYIYRCDIRALSLATQIISYDELLFLTSSAKEIEFQQIIVKSNDGKSVLPIEKIVEALPNVKRYIFSFIAERNLISPILPDNFLCDVRKTVISKSMKELIKIKHFSNIAAFNLNGINDTFDIETFYSYIKGNKHTEFWLIFDDSISEAYKNRLEKIIDEIIETKNLNYKTPLFSFPGLQSEQFSKLAQLSSR